MRVENNATRIIPISSEPLCTIQSFFFSHYVCVYVYAFVAAIVVVFPALPPLTPDEQDI